MKTRTIRQKAYFKAVPHEVYELLMDSKKHSAIGGGKCTISRKVGGRVSISDGYIVGKNLELVKDKKIVQLWRASEDCWPTDHYSTVTFALKEIMGGTGLAFTQTGVPVDCGDRFDSGWKEFYWEPMKEILESGSGSKSRK